MNTIVMEHFNSILFHMSGPTNKQHLSIYLSINRVIFLQLHLVNILKPYINTYVRIFMTTSAQTLKYFHLSFILIYLPGPIFSHFSEGLRRRGKQSHLVSLLFYQKLSHFNFQSLRSKFSGRNSFY